MRTPKPGPVPKDQVDKLVDAVLSAQPSYALLRKLAAAKYISSPSSPTLAELARDPEFSGISLNTLQRWAAEDDWIDQREAFYEIIRIEIQKRAAGKLVQARLNEFENYTDLQTLLFDKMRTTVIHANSLEGMVGAVVKLGEFLDKLRVAILEDVVPAKLGQAAVTPQLPSGSLTASEAHDAAMLILQKRREEQQSKNAKKPLDKA